MPRSPMMLDSTGQAMVTKLEAIKTAIENGGGGGGTTVIANPSGAATADLEKLQVGSTIYGIPNSIADADDVSLTNLSNDQILKYNSTTQKWENASSGGGGASNLTDLGDVAISTPTNGQVLTYDSANQKWVNAAGGGEGTVILADCYDYDEHEIGCWTNGKPLYQKTVHIASLPSTTSQTSYAHNILNIDEICDYETVVHLGVNGIAFKLDRLELNNYGVQYQNCLCCYVNDTNILITVGSNRSSASADVTIKYTKTTDSSGSGSFTPTGTYEVHYSETEKVIGTWVDGRSLYQISIPFTNLNCAANTYTAYNIASYLNNPDIVFVDQMMTYYIVNNVERLFENVMFESPNILFRTTTARTGIYGHVTVRYVKQST